MNEVTTQNTSYEFLNRAGLQTTQEIYDLLMYSYEGAVSSEPSIIIPTRRDILRVSLVEFSRLYFNYVLNGHGGRIEESYRKRIANGELEEDIAQELEDIYDSCHGSNLFNNHNNLEEQMLKEFDLALRLSNISYFHHEMPGDIFSYEDIRFVDWEHPGITQIW